MTQTRGFIRGMAGRTISSWFGLIVLLILASVLLLGVHISQLSKSLASHELRHSVETTARILSEIVSRSDDVARFCNIVKGKADLILELYSPEGIRICSESSFGLLPRENKTALEEDIRFALRGVTHPSQLELPDGKKLFSVTAASPDSRYVLRLSAQGLSSERISQAVFNRIFLGMSFIVFVLFLGALWLYKNLKVPLEVLRRGAVQFSMGDFSTKLPNFRLNEMTMLAHAMNRMGDALQATIQNLTEQKNERGAILASMVEAVFVFDLEEKIVNLNDAAAQFLEIRREAGIGKSVREVIKDADLRWLLFDAFKRHEKVDTELIPEEAHRRAFHVTVTPLRDKHGRVLGILVVLNDITRLKLLEKVRRDFVANVSHELKTPITAIKGFVETLLDGALEDRDSLERFLQIILAQSDRMTEIIEALLLLSRLENESAEGLIAFKDESLEDILRSVLDIFRAKAKEKDIEFRLACERDLKVSVDRSLFEQALMNLVDNALKYSPKNKEIFVRGYQEGGKVCISVEDQGPGVAPEHQDRLFERFYRVDKARSRDMGGTGLGLAIVKHVSGVHRGSVRLESKVGKGSSFTIELPRSESGKLYDIKQHGR